MPSKTKLVSSAPASPIVKLGVVPFITTGLAIEMLEPSADKLSKAMSPTFVILASLKDVAPKVLDAAVDVIPAAAVIPPPSAIVIALSPSVKPMLAVCTSPLTNKSPPTDASSVTVKSSSTFKSTTARLAKTSFTAAPEPAPSR